MATLSYFLKWILGECKFRIFSGPMNSNAEVNRYVNQSNRRMKNHSEIFTYWSFCCGISESTRSPYLIIVSIFLKFRVTLTKNWQSDIVWLLLEICIWIGKVTRFFWSEISCKIHFSNIHIPETFEKSLRQVFSVSGIAG